MKISDLDKSMDDALFKTKVDNIFVMLYTSIMQGDIKRVEHKLSDELYNKFAGIVENDLKNNYHHMYDELNVKSTEITSVEETPDSIKVNVTLISRYMDYITDLDYNYISGNNNSRDEHINKLVLEKKKNAADLNAIRRCPGCGAPADVSSTGECSYCGTTFNTEDYDYVLTSIEIS